jgi:hypothetical protein
MVKMTKGAEAAAAVAAAARGLLTSDNAGAAGHQSQLLPPPRPMVSVSKASAVHSACTNNPNNPPKVCLAHASP